MSIYYSVEKRLEEALRGRDRIGRGRGALGWGRRRGGRGGNNKTGGSAVFNMYFR